MSYLLAFIDKQKKNTPSFIIPLICVDLNGRISFRLPYLVTLHLVGKHVLPKMVTLFSNAGLSQLSGVPRFGALGVLCSWGSLYLVPKLISMFWSRGKKQNVSTIPRSQCCSLMPCQACRLLVFLSCIWISDFTSFTVTVFMFLIFFTSLILFDFSCVISSFTSPAFGPKLFRAFRKSKLTAACDVCCLSFSEPARLSSSRLLWL